MPTNDDLITAANKAFYALTAAEYDRMGRGMVVDVARTNAANILARVPSFSPDTTELMDFAAGTGLLAMFLAPRCKSVTAVDQSEEMIRQLRAKLEAQSEGERIENVEAVVTDILDGGDLGGSKFDVITCTNSYHHLSDPVKVTQVLAGYLKPGGHLAVVDLIKTDDSAEFHNAPTTVEREDGSHKQVEQFGIETKDDHHHHHGHSHGHASHQHTNVIAHRGGFSQSDMEHFFTSANLKLVDMGKSAHFVKDGKRYDNFLAIAQAPM
ncbi:Methyltransferase type 12 [Kalmanozyma brasiliensis GHG001]|uniref:Methyltransferase type 12 domain-containing protein n=1 Tax=Kalmanozyma brasiliensis (strain GHG001) TaxID=1365824 RepID=V5EHA0_KALBG|nr:Methyltransferase type 12 [Kalmanozyma brasiliensis GHG001]EST09961.1 Methyltransferase type 12 [Kalmanozyma brasiliensis GHG001]